MYYCYPQMKGWERKLLTDQNSIHNSEVLEGRQRRKEVWQEKVPHLWPCDLNPIEKPRRRGSTVLKNEPEQQNSKHACPVWAAPLLKRLVRAVFRVHLQWAKPVTMKFLMRFNLVSVHWTLILMYKQIMERKEGTEHWSSHILCWL